jgi:hypothetical protein
MDKILIILLYVLLGATTGIQKLMGPFPPIWFSEKFKDSIIGLFPGGIPLSFAIIIFLELAIAASFLAALIKKECRNESAKTFSRLGFNASLILFLILFFGSFLVQDYDNGFFDFTYFGITIFLMKYYFKEEGRSISNNQN